MRAAETVLAVESAAIDRAAPDTVATTGVCRVHPGAINSIPDRVTLEIDIRDIDLATRDRVVGAIRQAFDAIGGRRAAVTVVESLNADPPPPWPSIVREAIGRHARSWACRAAAWSAGLITIRCSWPGSLPTGMIFIPCRDGISHRPEEFSTPEAIGAGSRFWR